jgi:DNA (cytosine-5)-methyltransferase 1
VAGSEKAVTVAAIRLTIPELATLQGFPPDWTWCGNKTAQVRQVGNAVPPALAEAVASVNRPVAMECAA